MATGGEVVNQGGDESTGWEEVAALASQAPDSNQELAVGALSDKSVSAEQDDAQARERLYDAAVFTNVDTRKLNEYIREYIEPIDLKELNQLRENMQGDTERGLELAEDYFVDLFDLKNRPEVLFDDLADGRSSECSMGPVTDTIGVSNEFNGNTDRLLMALVHENWHSLQHEQIREAMASIKRGEDVDDVHVVLYMHNKLHYIRPEDDIAGYMTQLIEREAYAIENAFGKKLREADKMAEDEEFIEQHPEIYGDENLVGIRKEIGAALDGKDIKSLLDGARVESMGEFLELGNDIESNAQRYTDGLVNFLGLKDDINVEFADVLPNNANGWFDFKNKRVVLSRNSQKDVFGEVLPKFVWAFRQQNIMQDESDSERSAIYKGNNRHFVPRGQDAAGFERQLLIRERAEFARTLMEIFNEQKVEEELRAMPLLSRMAGKFRMRMNSAPTLSKEYNIKRSW